MKCESCKSKLDEKWNFCPNCGFMVEKNTSLTDYLNQQLRHLSKMMMQENIGINELGFPENMKINININAETFDVKINKKRKYTINQEPRKLPENVFEPETKINNTNNITMVILKVPGVESVKDIDISILSDSVEVRAFALEKGYFKIIKMPSKFNLIDKEFNNGELTLYFSE